MKKIFSVFLLLVLLVSVCGCSIFDESFKGEKWVKNSLNTLFNEVEILSSTKQDVKGDFELDSLNWYAEFDEVDKSMGETSYKIKVKDVEFTLKNYMERDTHGGTGFANNRFSDDFFYQLNKKYKSDLNNINSDVYFELGSIDRLELESDGESGLFKGITEKLEDYGAYIVCNSDEYDTFNVEYNVFLRNSSYIDEVIEFFEQNYELKKDYYKGVKFNEKYSEFKLGYHIYVNLLSEDEEELVDIFSSSGNIESNLDIKNFERAFKHEYINGLEENGLDDIYISGKEMEESLPDVITKVIFKGKEIDGNTEDISEQFSFYYNWENENYYISIDTLDFANLATALGYEVSYDKHFSSVDTVVKINDNTYKFVEDEKYSIYLNGKKLNVPIILLNNRFSISSTVCNQMFGTKSVSIGQDLDCIIFE